MDAAGSPYMQVSELMRAWAKGYGTRQSHQLMHMMVMSGMRLSQGIINCLNAGSIVAS
jgi:hypothetical protein